MVRPDISALPANIKAYIAELESCIHGSDELSVSLSKASSKLAQDIDNLCDPQDNYAYKILKGDAKDKHFDQLMNVFNIFGTKIIGVTKKMKPAEQVGKFKAEGGNYYEHALKEAKNGKSKV